MSAPVWIDLKADGRVVVDARARKLAVYPNQSGQVVMLSVEDGVAMYSTVEPDEIPALVSALLAANVEASKLQLEFESSYAAFQAIQQAKGA